MTVLRRSDLNLPPEAGGSGLLGSPYGHNRIERLGILNFFLDKKSTAGRVSSQARELKRLTVDAIALAGPDHILALDEMRAGAIR